jgi:hypothetical protein
MKTQFFDLKIETLEDGTVRLEQADCGESAIIDLHPQQVLYMAACLTEKTLPNRYHTVTLPLLDRITTLERRMLWMQARFGECYAALPSDLYERCAEAREFFTWLDASIDVVTEFCIDIGGVEASPVSDDDLPTHPLPADATKSALQGDEHAQATLC